MFVTEFNNEMIVYNKSMKSLACINQFNLSIGTPSFMAHTLQTFRQIMVWFIIIVLIVPGSAQDLAIIVPSSQINAIANYTLAIPNLFYDVPFGATLAVTFPPQYSAVRLRSMAPYSSYDPLLGDYCYIDASCSVTISVSGNTLFLNGLFTQNFNAVNGYFFMQLTIFNIQNPDSLNVGPFYMTVFQGSTIYYRSLNGSSVERPTFTPSTMSSSIALSVSSLWMASVLTITLTPNSLIDTLQFDFLSMWTNETVSSNVKIGNAICTSSSNPTITCNSSATSLEATNLNYFTASVPLDVSIHSIYNPSAIVDIGSVTVSGKRSGVPITSASINLPATLFAPDVLRQVTATVSYQTGDQIQLVISFSIPHTSMPGDKFQIIFPSDFTISTSASNYSISGPYTTSTPPINFTSSNNSLTFQPFSASYISKASLTITIRNLIRPRQSKPTGNFTISSYREGKYLMERISCCSLQLQNRQTLISSTPQLSSTQRSIPGVTYTFSLTTVRVNLITTDYIVIEFPPEYSGQISASNQSTICAGISLQAINNPANIQTPPACTVTTNSIRLASFLINSLSGPETLIVEIAGLINPSKPLGSGFGVATKSVHGYVLQQIRGLTVTITDNTLTSFLVASDSLETNKPDSTYTFTIGNNADVHNGYTLRINFPADFTHINYNIMLCQVAALSMPCARLNSTYSSDTQIVLIKINQTVSTIGTATISGVTNPPTTAPTAAFSASIIDTSGTTVQSNGNAPIITMNSAGPFSSVVATTLTLSGSRRRQERITEVNKGTTLSLFLITPFQKQLGSSSLTITLSNSSAAYLNGSANCSSWQFTSICNSSVDGSGDIIVNIWSISLSSPNTNYLTVEIHNLVVHNHKNLTLSAVLSSNGYTSLVTSAPVAVGTMYAQTVTNYSISQTNYTLGATADVSILIGLSSQTKAQADTFRVYIPQEYTAPNHIVDISHTAYLDDSITISAIVNPSTYQYTPFLFQVLDNSGNIIAYSLPNDNQSYSFALGCNLPCKECSTNKSQCTSCYTDISWISEKYLSNSSNTCLTTCPDDHYLSGTICFRCDTKCLTCLTYGANYSDGLSNNCLSCNSSAYLFNSTCYTTCPQGYYPSSPICSPCMSNCLTCSNYSSCLSCNSTLALYQSQCLEACPGGYFWATNLTTNESRCMGCPTNCLVCSSNSTCTNCQRGFFLSGGSCVSNCSGGLLPDYQLRCSTCLCQGCSGTSYNCTSCNNSLSLFNNQCLVNCPTGYYSFSNVCQPCMSNCDACNSASYCSICQLPFVLLITSSSVSQCLSNCPNSTIPTINTANFSYICSSCSDNCLTCLIVTNYCTSCSTPYLLSNHSCTLACPPEQFNHSNTCVYCYPQCSSCNSSNPNICYTCSGGYYLSGTSCLTSCPNATYPNISTLYCTSCSLLCLTCQNSTHCTSCISNYFLYRNYCYANCSAIDPNYYSYNGTCLYCQPQCSSCYASSPLECVNCSSSLYYYNPTTKACTIDCASPYYANGSQCVLCELPCLSCDTSYNSCLTCSNGLISYKGSCITSCPNSYKNQSGVCTSCSSNCLTCDATRCTVCQPYAYFYNNQCILDCSILSDMPIAVNNYCTNCEAVPYCQQCKQTTGRGYNCFLCVYPYVVFDGNCLNECPKYYQPDSNRFCQQTPAFTAAQDTIYQQNKSKAPFIFLICFVMGGLILTVLAQQRYVYTYHYGFLLSLAAMVDTFCILYGMYYISSFYEGDYTYSHRTLPLIIVATSFIAKLALSLIFLLVVVGNLYLEDPRYLEWKQNNRASFYLMVILNVLFGPRIHKLFYSKLWALPALSYRIVSVQKFYQEDVINWLLIFADLADISAFVVVAYNIFISYAVLYLLPFEVIAIKMIIWVIFLYDLKKPDRGFFFGDEEEAELQIKLEEEALQKKQKKFQMESLAKLIRCQSAGQLQHERLYDFIFFDDTKSVYNINDYEDHPKVPNKKILKNIERGRFRKGKKISIEEKLRRFAESIKPAPEVKPDNSYLKDLIYWRPPKQMKVKNKVQPKQTQQSMLNLLRDKELYYESQLREAQIQELDEEEVLKDPHRRRKGKSRYLFEVDQETIGNQTFYEPSSIEHLQMDDFDMNGLMNRNYARKKHLPNRLSHDYDEQDLRVLRHLPLKKRSYRSRLNELSIRRG